jgi:hypothetical protein
MGIGTLRRYHKPLDNAGVSQEAPAVAPGITDTEAEAAAAAEANAAKLAAEQAAQADRANADEDGAQSVHPIVQEAGGVEDNPATGPATIPAHPEGVESENGTEHEEVQTGVPVTPGTAEGEAANAEATEQAQEAEQAAAAEAFPSRGASTADWVAFAESHPDPSRPLDLSPRTGLRDEIATYYLGAAE